MYRMDRILVDRFILSILCIHVKRRARQFYIQVN